VLTGCWILFGARSEASQDLRFAVVFSGIGIGYALLGEFGSIWPLLAMSAVTWTYIWRISRSQDKQHASGAVWWFGAIVAALVLVHVFFTDWPFGWVVALQLTLGVPCIVIARMLIEPGEAPALVPSDEQNVSTPSGHKNRIGRLASADELLGLGWVILAFWLFCWTQPEKIDVGAPPTFFGLPEPSPDLAFGGGSLSESAARYSAEWDRYNARQFENELDQTVYYETSRYARSWNAHVGAEVKTRQIIKTATGIAVLGFSWFHSRRAARRKKEVADETMGNSGVAPMQRA